MRGVFLEIPGRPNRSHSFPLYPTLVGIHARACRSGSAASWICRPPFLTNQQRQANILLGGNGHPISQHHGHYAPHRTGLVSATQTPRQRALSEAFRLALKTEVRAHCKYYDTRPARPPGPACSFHPAAPLCSPRLGSCPSWEPPIRPRRSSPPSTVSLLRQRAAPLGRDKS